MAATSCKIDNRERSRDLTEKFDRSVGSFAWISRIHDADFLHRGRSRRVADLFMAMSQADEQPIRTWRLHADDLVFADDSAEIGRLFFTQISISAPNEIWQNRCFGPRKRNASSAAVTHMNDALLSQIDMQPLESFTFKGANNDEVQGFMVKPPGFDPNKKYPLKFLIHGGPQGAWGNDGLSLERGVVRGERTTSWS